MLSALVKKHFILIQDDLMFVPYLKQMIPTYHKWMSDPQILYLTGSEPLSLEEELTCQQDWLNDPSKYTFIIMKKNPEFDTKSLENLEIDQLGDYLQKSGEMVGDINLFFHEYIEPNEAEIDVMIGDVKFRQQGIAKRALEVMMSFGLQIYKRDTFIAKIKKDNQASIKLFNKIGFKFSGEVECFNEMHYTMQVLKKEADYQLIELNF